MVVTFGRKGKVEVPIKSRVVEVKATDYPVNEYSMTLAADMAYVSTLLKIQEKYGGETWTSSISGRFFIVKKLLTECMAHRNRVAYLKRMFGKDLEMIGMYLKAFELYQKHKDV